MPNCTGELSRQSRFYNLCTKHLRERTVAQNNINKEIVRIAGWGVPEDADWRKRVTTQLWTAFEVMYGTM
jgi:hypothetical protein